MNEDLSGFWSTQFQRFFFLIVLLYASEISIWLITWINIGSDHLGPLIHPQLTNGHFQALVMETSMNQFQFFSNKILTLIKKRQEPPQLRLQLAPSCFALCSFWNEISNVDVFLMHIRWFYDKWSDPWNVVCLVLEQHQSPSNRALDSLHILFGTNDPLSWQTTSCTVTGERLKFTVCALSAMAPSGCCKYTVCIAPLELQVSILYFTMQCFLVVLWMFYYYVATIATVKKLILAACHTNAENTSV